MLLFLQLVMASLATTLNSSGGGKVMLYINEVSLADHTNKMLHLNSKLHYFPLSTVSSLASEAFQAPHHVIDAAPHYLIDTANPATSVLAHRD